MTLITREMVKFCILVEMTVHFFFFFFFFLNEKQENIIQETKAQTKQPKGQGDKASLFPKEGYSKTLQFKLMVSIE